MCNHPERLGAALAPLGLSVPGPITRWAMAWVHGGEVLVARFCASSTRDASQRSIAPAVELLVGVLAVGGLPPEHAVRAVRLDVDFAAVLREVF